MSDFNYSRDYNTVEYGRSEVAENTLIKDVYLWMAGALTITGLTAYYVSGSYELLSLIFGNRMVFFGMIFAELGLVIGLSAAINKLSALTATIMFLIYSVLNGATLASIFLVYELSSVTTLFFVTAGTFGLMALYGSITKTDLTKMGKLCIMGLIGIIIASIVNIFLGNSMMDMIISALGIIIFVGLIAWDSQKIKAMFYGAEVNDTTQKLAVLGALTLYLDFVNLFLHILRMFGKRN